MGEVSYSPKYTFWYSTNFIGKFVYLKIWNLGKDKKNAIVLSSVFFDVYNELKKGESFLEFSHNVIPIMYDDYILKNTKYMKNLSIY